jgi:hypothetical protein
MAEHSLAALKRWILLDAGRGTVAAGVLVATFVVVYGLVGADVAGVAKIGPVRTLFGSIVTGVFTVVSIVLSINQVILSRIFGSPGELTDRMESSLEFHREVENRIEATVAPTDPDDFLGVLMEGLGDQADQLHREADQEDVSEYADGLESYAMEVGEALEDDNQKASHVLSTILKDDYSESIQRARELRVKYEDDLSAEATDALEDLVETLQDVGVMRQYFETVYMHEELASLSRWLLYLGFPVLVIASLVILLYARAGGPPLSLGALELVVSTALTLSFAPLAVVLAVVFRVATVGRMTAAVGPFTPRSGSRSD